MSAFKNYDMIRSIDELEKYVDRMINEGQVVGYDCETGYYGDPKPKRSLHPETAFITGYSFTNELTWARYVPTQHDIGENLDRKWSAYHLWRMVRTLPMVGHNLCFELRHLSKWFMKWLSDDPDFGPEVQASQGYYPIFSDTMIEAFILAEWQHFGLKFLTEAVFDHKMTELYELFPDMPKNKMDTLRFNLLPLTPEVIDYACEDSLWALAFHQKNYPQVKDELVYSIDMKLIPITAKMEDYGIKYDWQFMADGAAEGKLFLDKQDEEIQAGLSEMVGEEIKINLNSHAQVYNVLYDKLGMTTNRLTKNKDQEKRKMSTDKIALEGLSAKHPAVKSLVEWKELKLLTNSFLGKYEEKYGFSPDGMVHASYMQCGTITARYAVASPPVHSSPKKYHYKLKSGEEFKINFRDAIIAPEDHYILGFDLSQAELRALAGEAQEFVLLEAFERGEDVHSRTAAIVEGISIEEVTEDQRQVKGKTINFAIPYGLSVKGLSDRLDLDDDAAQELYDRLTGAYPAIATYTDRQVQFGKKHGYVLSKFGRRLPIWEYTSDKFYVRQKGDRACVNYTIQCSATGDYVRIVMIKAHDALDRAGLLDRVHLFLNHHDALEYYVHRSVDPQTVINLLKPAVTFPVDGWPEMVADWNIGRSWGTLKKLAFTPEGTAYIAGAHVPSEHSEDISTPVPAPPLTSTDKAAIKASLAEREKEIRSNQLRAAEVALTAPEVSSDDTPHQVVVELVKMPNNEAFMSFMKEVNNKPGFNTLVIKTPEGELTLDDKPTSLSPADQPRISILLGGASVHFIAEDITPESIVGGLQL